MLPFVILLVVAVSPEVYGYGTGAPSSTCRDMMPHHGMNRPITSQAPYRISLSKQTYGPGETIVVTLQGVSQTTFRGYLMQARPIGRAAFVGAFGAPQGAQTVACGFGGFEGVTHTERSDKQQAVFHWTAPTTSAGRVVIIATVVHSYNNFWIGLTSPVISPETATDSPPLAPTPTPAVPTTRQTVPVPTARTTTPRNSVVTLRPVWTKRPLPIPTTKNPRFVPAVQPATDDEAIEAISQGSTGSNFLLPDPECGKTKGCYMKCNKQTCKFVVTWQSRGATVRFQVASVVATTQTDNWIAIGLSDDTKMGSDSVTECVSESGLVQVFQSYNDGYSNRRLANPKIGITGEAGNIVNGIMRCEFDRAIAVPGMSEIYDLNEDWHLMFAHGAASNGFRKSMHGTSKDTMPITSPLKIDYQNFQVVDEEAKYPLVKVHACFMLLAWVFFTGIGIITARYYKSVWEYSTLLGLRIWFQIHRACMVAAFALTIIAFIIIFVEAQGYSRIAYIPGQGYLRAHPVLGIIVTILVIVNPIMSLFRPPPATTRRPIFNWAHWGVGMLAHLLAVLTICFGIQLGKSSTPDTAVYVMVGCVLYQVLFGVILEALKFIEKRKLEKAKMEALEMKPPGSSGSLSNGSSRTASTAITLMESPIRKILLLIHVIAMFGFTLALILLVALN